MVADTTRDGNGLTNNAPLKPLFYVPVRLGGTTTLSGSLLWKCWKKKPKERYEIDMLKIDMLVIWTINSAEALWQSSERRCGEVSRIPGKRPLISG